MTAPDRARLGDEINKRLTLNWLIQGAAVHAGLNIHHLVGKELAAIAPELPRLYDRLTISIQLQFWRGEFVLWSSIERAWRMIRHRGRSPLHQHRLISRYDRLLSNAERQRTLARAKAKGVSRIPVLFSFQIAGLMPRIDGIERPHHAAIEAIAHRAAAMVFDIPIERLRGKLVPRRLIDRDRLPRPQSLVGWILLIGAVSWSDVAFEDEAPFVRAQAANGCLLIAELVKGTAELICLHGLNELDDETYAEVLRTTDLIDFEAPMIKTGGELWRRFLHALPADLSPAQTLMRMARLPPPALESLVEQIILESPAARESLHALFDDA